MLFFAKRPGPAAGWGGGRLTVRLYTRVGSMTTNEAVARRLARKHGGRLYGFDGCERFLADFGS